MNAPLRPMSLGEILDRTIHIYRSRFLVFVGIALAAPISRLAVILLGLLLNEALEQTTLSLPVKQSLRHLDLMGFASLIAAFVSVAAVPALAYAASLEFLGERPTIRGSITRCALRWRSWLLYSAIVCAVVYLAPIAIVNPSYLVRSLGSSAAANIGMVNLGLMITIGRGLIEFCLGALVLLSAPVWILEGKSSWAAIRRGAVLARRSLMALFVAWILKTIILWIVGIATTSLPVLLLRLISRDIFLGNFLLYRIVFLTGASIAEALAGPLYVIAITLIYYDQRIRKEGYDIERMMDAAGMSAPATPVVVVAGDSAEAEVQPG